MTPAAIRFLQGDNSLEVLSELRAAMLRWSEQTGGGPLPLHRMFGLGGPSITLTELRNAILIKAADLLAADLPPDATRWLRCQNIAKRTKAFEVSRWPSWRKAEAPPESASAVNRLFFEARKLSGTALPRTPEAFLSILPID